MIYVMFSLDPALRKRKAFVSTLILGGLGLTACNSSQPEAKINPTIHEPICTGTTLSRIDKEVFKVSPVLVGSFVQPNNVFSYILFPTVEAPALKSPTLVNTGGVTPRDMQVGPGFRLGLQ